MKRLIGITALVSTALLMAGFWIPLKAQVAQVLLDKAWAETQSRQMPTRPWPWADTWPVARLELPEQGQSLIVLAGDSGESLAFGPGHLSQSSLPGEKGPVVLAGHRDTHFRSLADLRRGHPLRLQDQRRQWHDYEVISFRVVNSDQELLDLNAFAPDRLVLITCYPFNSVNAGGPLRYVVEAARSTGSEPSSLRL